MTTRFPAPLRPGDRAGVTAPSTGVPADVRARLDFAIERVRARGYEVGRPVHGWRPARQRARRGPRGS